MGGGNFRRPICIMDCEIYCCPLCMVATKQIVALKAAVYFVAQYVQWAAESFVALYVLWVAKFL